MTAVQAGLAAAVVLAVAGAVAALLVPRSGRPGVVGAATALCGGAGVLTGVAALLGPGLTVSLPGLLPLAGIVVTVDPLGGLFVAVVGAVAIPVGIYGVGYSRHGLDGRGVQAAGSRRRPGSCHCTPGCPAPIRRRPATCRR